VAVSWIAGLRVGAQYLADMMDDEVRNARPQRPLTHREGKYWLRSAGGGVPASKAAVRRASAAVTEASGQ